MPTTRRPASLPAILRVSGYGTRPMIEKKAKTIHQE